MSSSSPRAKSFDISFGSQKIAKTPFPLNPGAKRYSVEAGYLSGDLSILNRHPERKRSEKHAKDAAAGS
jgi:hypothetical protein